MRALILATILILCGTGAARADCDLVPNGTTIPSPETRPEGTIIYNADENVFQGCIGTRWVELQGISGYMCGYVQGACPQANSGQNGCLSDQALTWTTTSCSTNGDVRTIVFGMPSATGVSVGGNDVGSDLAAGRAFCADLGLAFTEETHTSSSSGHWMDPKATTSSDATFWRDRGTTTSQRLLTVTCTDLLSVP